MELIAVITVFALVYSFADAWHDEKVINKINKGPFNWHIIDAGIKAMVAGFVSWLAFGFTGYALLMAIFILALRWASFDFFLNKLMNWSPNYGRKKGLDRVPFWGRWLLVAIVGFFIIFIRSKTTL